MRVKARGANVFFLTARLNANTRPAHAREPLPLWQFLPAAPGGAHLCSTSLKGSLA